MQPAVGLHQPPARRPPEHTSRSYRTEWWYRVIYPFSVLDAHALRAASGRAQSIAAARPPGSASPSWSCLCFTIFDEPGFFKSAGRSLNRMLAIPRGERDAGSNLSRPIGAALAGPQERLVLAGAAVVPRMAREAAAPPPGRDRKLGTLGGRQIRPPHRRRPEGQSLLDGLTTRRSRRSTSASGAGRGRSRSGAGRRG